MFLSQAGGLCACNRDDNKEKTPRPFGARSFSLFSRGGLFPGEVPDGKAVAVLFCGGGAVVDNLDGAVAAYVESMAVRVSGVLRYGFGSDGVGGYDCAVLKDIDCE